MSDLTPVASPSVSPAEAPATPRGMAWPYVAGVIALALISLLAEPWLVFGAIPAALVIALFVPRTHRLPGALRALIYLLAAAVVVWVAIVGFFIYELSHPGVHLG